jgi:3-hydroxyisobutyrate dehydrogenase
MAKVAFIGLGVMGYPMAGHLKVKGGHEVTVYNRTFAKAEKWAAEFGGKARTPAEAAADADFVFTCVGNDDDLRSVTIAGRRFRRHEARAPSSSTTPPPRPMSRANSTPPRRQKGSASSMPQSPAARPARRTAC